MPDSASQKPITLSAPLYLGIWVALLILTTTTFLLHKVELGWLHVPVALLIACTKSGLIVWFFMHMIEHRGANRLAMLVPVVLLVVLTVLSWADLRTRFKPAVPPGPFPLEIPRSPALGPTRRIVPEPRERG